MNIWRPRTFCSLTTWERALVKPMREAPFLLNWRVGMLNFSHEREEQ